MGKRKEPDSDNKYELWIKSEVELYPPFDYFSFDDIANTNEEKTNSMYLNILYKEIVYIKKSQKKLVVEAINVYKVNPSLIVQNNFCLIYFYHFLVKE